MKSGSSIIVLRVFTYFQHYDKVIEKKANYSALTPLPNVGKSLTNRLPNSRFQLMGTRRKSFSDS